MTLLPSPLLCPRCQEPLIRVEKAFQCSRSHSYDIAREGYVNLLLANQKASLSPGDTKEMAASRRIFLDKGYYALLANRIASLTAEGVSGAEEHVRILDAGCGEGYYLHYLRQSLPFKSENYGLDISKEAVKRGASKYKDSQFLVASIHQKLPIAPLSMDVVLNIFAPRSPAEFARVLRPKGMVLVVVPAEGHLAALHDLLELPHIDDDKERRAVEDFRDMLVPSYCETIRYRQTLPPEDVLHLIQMTPTFWHLSDEARAGTKELPSLDIEFAFTLIVLHRVSDTVT